MTKKSQDDKQFIVIILLHVWYLTKILHTE